MTLNSDVDFRQNKVGLEEEGGNDFDDSGRTHAGGSESTHGHSLRVCFHLN